MAFGIKVFFIVAAVTVAILMILYAAYAGGRRNARGHAGRFGNFQRGTRRLGDSENGQRSDSVDTLPRYTASGEGDVAPPAQVHGSDEHDRVEEEEEVEGPKPPPYTFDASGPVTEAEDGDGHGEGDAEIPASPAPVHFQSL
ncbi:MAG: hypothetical protein Q9175_007245 [Cornicularia normoerica]